MSLYINIGKKIKLNILLQSNITLINTFTTYVLIVEQYITIPKNTAKNKYSLNSFSKL